MTGKTNLLLCRLLLALAAAGTLLTSFLALHVTIKDRSSLTYPSPLEENAFFWALDSEGWLQRSDFGSRVVLLESGKAIGDRVSDLRTVKQVGGGAFFLYDKNIYFSSSDNSSPEQNGRIYEVAELAYVAPPWIYLSVGLTVLFWILFVSSTWKKNMESLVLPARYLPREALNALAGLLVFFLILGCIVEFLLLPWLVGENLLTDTTWEQENAIINTNTEAENPHSLAPEAEWIWTSAKLGNLAKPENEFRILVVGDSFVWGDGLANINDTIWRQLERILHAAGHSNVRVIGFGQCGASTLDQFNALQTHWESLDADLVLWQYVDNDADLGRYPQIDMSYAANDPLVKDLERIGNLGFLPRTMDFLVGKRKRAVENRGSLANLGFTYAEWLKLLLSEENLQKYSGVIKNIQQWSNVVDVPVVFYPVPNQVDDRYFFQFFAPIKKIFEDQQIPWIDTLASLSEKTQNWGLLSILEWGANPANGHPGILINRPVAMSLTDWILSEEILTMPAAEQPDNESEVAPRINHVRPWNLEVAQVDKVSWQITLPKNEGLHLTKPFNTPSIVLYFREPVRVQRLSFHFSDLPPEVIYVQTEVADLEYPIQQWTDVSPRPSSTKDILVHASEFKDQSINAIAIGMKSTNDSAGATFILSLE